MVSLSLRIFVLQDYGGAHPLVMDALAEMSEAQMQMRLTHPPVRAQYPRRRDKEETAGMLPAKTEYRQDLFLQSVPLLLAGYLKFFVLLRAHDHKSLWINYDNLH